MRLIDADALLNREVYYDRAECLVLRYEIEKAPTIDAVPVVRCKECKHGNMFSEEKHLIDCPYYDDQVVDFEHFCAYGERRADNG